MNKSPIYMILANGYAGAAAIGTWSRGRSGRDFRETGASWHLFDLIGGVAVLWLHRSRSRRALLALDDHGLRDIGFSRADALREGRKPFWR
jgi:uncharacterized protein YjiS (DUF1127 family)